MTDHDAPAVLTIPEAARYLRLSRSKTYQLAQTGDLPVVRFGRSVRIRRHELDQWLTVQARATVA